MSQQPNPEPAAPAVRDSILDTATPVPEAGIVPRDQLAHARVLVVGDVMLDRYWYGDATRISPEAPVPVMLFREEEFRLGGAASYAAPAPEPSSCVDDGKPYDQKTLGANVAFHSAEFQRAGRYPDSASDPLTPWGGQPFPLVKSTGKPLPIPQIRNTPFGPMQTWVMRPYLLPPNVE